VNSKRKGDAGERELAEYFRSHGYGSTRNRQMYIGGMGNPDIALGGLHCEIKRTESLRFHESLAQAIRDANGKAKPTLIHRRNRSPWTVTMLLTDWIDLYRAWRPPDTS